MLSSFVQFLFQLEKERADHKCKSRMRQFFGLGSSSKTSPTAAVANSNSPADDGQSLDDLITALRSAADFY